MFIIRMSKTHKKVLPPTPIYKLVPLSDINQYNNFIYVNHFNPSSSLNE